MKDIKRTLRTAIMPHILKKFWYVNMGKEQLNEIFCTADFVRFSQIEKLLMNEALPKGSIAELGVYKGRLTKLLAKAAFLLDRKLFLFDTFEGFEKTDFIAEKLNGLNTNFEDFADTDSLIVHNICIKAGMPTNNIRIKKGWFPDTFDIESRSETYAFVSLDFDLYEPTKVALNLIYDRVAEGGFVAVHDYGNRNYSGVKKAVDEFINERNIKCHFELCDYCGTMLIKKVQS